MNRRDLLKLLPPGIIGAPSIAKSISVSVKIGEEPACDRDWIVEQCRQGIPVFGRTLYIRKPLLLDTGLVSMCTIHVFDDATVTIWPPAYFCANTVISHKEEQWVGRVTIGSYVVDDWGK